MKIKKLILYLFILLIILTIFFILYSKIENTKNIKNYSNSYFDENQYEESLNLQNVDSPTIQIYDIEEGYMTVPSIPNISKHSYAWDNLYYENNFLKYSDSKYETKLGVDVSSYQGNINWTKVKQQGIDFAIIRLGYRGYGKAGNIVFDKKYFENIQQASNVGLKIGVYFFSQAINENEAIEEANFVLDNIKDYKIDFPVCYDLEKIKFDDDARANHISKEERTQIAIAFCEKIKQSGYSPYIYANAKWLTTELELEKLQDYDIWYADYQENPIYPYNFTMWQYTESATVDGIEGTSDLNLFFNIIEK